MYQLKVKFEVGLKFETTFLTQHLGLSIFDPNLGSNYPELFRVFFIFINHKCSCKSWIYLQQIKRYGVYKKLWSKS